MAEYKDVASQFEAMSGGLQASDFEKIIGRVAKGMKDSYLTQEKYNEIIERQTKQNKNDLDQTQKRIRAYKTQDKILSKIMPWKYRELKHLQQMNKLQKESATLLKRHNNSFSNMFSGMKKGGMAAAQGIGKIVTKLGAAGAVVVVLKQIVDAFLRMDAFAAKISKTFGVSRNAARGYRKELIGATSQMSSLLVTLEQAHEIGSELAVEMGGYNNVTRDAVTTTTLLSKAFNIAAKDAANFYSVMSINLGKSSEEVESITMNLKATAERYGVSASLAMRSFTSAASLAAMSTGKTVEDMKNMSISAARVGSTLESVYGVSNKFILDFEGSSEAIAQINNRLNMNLRPDLMAINAETGDWEKNLNYVLDAVDKYAARGEYSLTTQEALAQLGGKQYSDLLAMAKLRSQRGAGSVTDEIAKQEKLADLVRDQMMAWDKIKGALIGPITSVLNRIGEYLQENINPIINSISKESQNFTNALLGAWDKGNTFGEKLSNVWQVFKDEGKESIKEIMTWATSDDGVITQIKKVGAMLGAGLLSGIWSAIKTSRIGKIIAGGLATAAVGAGVGTAFGGIGAIPGALLGFGLGASGVGLATYDYGGGQATGNVFNSPHMALIGEEGRSEVVIPTERVRKGLPVHPSVARELASIGVPGYVQGRAPKTTSAAAQSAYASMNAAAAQNVLLASASDPESVRKRNRDFQITSNAHTEELRRMYRRENEQQLKVLEAEEANQNMFSENLQNWRSGMGGMRAPSGMKSVNSVDRMWNEGISELKTQLKDIWRDVKGYAKSSFQAWKTEKEQEFRELARATAGNVIGRLPGAGGFGQRVSEIGWRGALEESSARQAKNFDKALRVAGDQRATSMARYKASKKASSQKDSLWAAINAQAGPPAPADARSSGYGGFIGGIVNDIKGAALSAKNGIVGGIKSFGGSFSAGLKEMGGLPGVGKAGLTEGALAATSVIDQQGLSVKSLKTAGKAGIMAGGSMALGSLASLGLRGMGLPEELSKALGGTIGKIAMGGIGKLLGFGGGWSKKKKRQKAMKAFTTAVRTGNLSGFAAGGTLLKSIISSKTGKIDEVSKLRTLKEMASILKAKGLDVTPQDVEPLMWALIAKKEESVEAQLPVPPDEIINSFQSQLNDAKATGGGGPTAAGRSAATARMFNGATSARSAPRTAAGVTPSRASLLSAGGGSADGNFGAMLDEIQSMRRTIENRGQNIRIDMDGRKVAELVSENQEGIGII